MDDKVKIIVKNEYLVMVDEKGNMYYLQPHSYCGRLESPEELYPILGEFKIEF